MRIFIVVLPAGSNFFKLVFYTVVDVAEILLIWVEEAIVPIQLFSCVSNLKRIERIEKQMWYVTLFEDQV